MTTAPDPATTEVDLREAMILYVERTTGLARETLTARTTIIEDILDELDAKVADYLDAGGAS